MQWPQDGMQYVPGAIEAAPHAGAARRIDRQCNRVQRDRD
jgi:hypothetical protein